MSARPADRDGSLEAVLRIGLAAGVVLSLVLLLFGFGALLLEPGDPPIDTITRYPADAFPRDLRGVVDGMAQGRPLAFVQGGLLMLIATPLLRVTLAGLVFCRQRDWLFAGVALAVLVLLLWGWRGL
jgi:uncharacterized membrane protein